MPYLIAAAGITLLLYWRFGQRGLAVAFLLIAILAASRGLTALAVPLMLAAYYLFRNQLNYPLNTQSRSNTRSTNPTVRSRFLEMHLDQQSGKLSGKILDGEYTDYHCSDLSLEQLLELLIIYHNEDAESEQLLMAYLDQAHPTWQERASEFNRDQTSSSKNQMTLQEAYEILGVPNNATEEEVKSAHRRLMKKFHPDQGGSSHLAAMINQAKEMILNNI